MISVFDLFKVGVGPSSSHTVGPMKAARLFAEGLFAEGGGDAVAAVSVELFGSLGAIVAIAAGLSLAWAALAVYLGNKMNSWTRVGAPSSPRSQPERSR